MELLCPAFFQPNRHTHNSADEVTNNAESFELLLVPKQQLKAQNELLKREVTLLKEKIDLLIRRLFGTILRRNNFLTTAYSSKNSTSDGNQYPYNSAD